MVKIQLETGYLDVKEGADFPLNFGVAEIRDLTKRSGTFSKSITLVGSKNNHDLLNHYYDVNIEAGTFNINTLTKCTVLQNDIPILSDASLQLTAVNKKQISGAYEERVEYIVVVKDAQSDFFTKIDNLLLEDIDLSDLNNEFNATNILGSFTNTVTDGYVYLLPYTPTDQLPINEFKPAVYSKIYWDRIHQSAGFQYEWSGLSNALFDKTVIPYNGGQLLFDYEDFLVEANRNVTLSHTPVAGLSTNFNTNLTGWTETVDAQLLFDPTTGEYEVPFNMSAGQGLNFEITIDFDVNLNNATGGDVWLVDMDAAAAVKYFLYSPNVSVINGTTQIAAWNIIPSLQNTVTGTPVFYTRNEGVLPNGVTNLGGGTYTFNLASSPLNVNDILKVRGGMGVLTGTVGTLASSNVRWKATNSTGAADVVVSQQLVINNISIRVLPNPNVIVQDATVVMNNYIPKKVKQKDFIKSICQMYNLFVEPSMDNPNKLIYRHRDEYYDNGNAVDWTLKLAKDQEQVLQFLPELSAKKLLLTYKQDSDLPNTLYEDATREIYGQLEFTYDNEYIRNVDRKELIFSPTPMMPNLFGAIVPMIGGEPKTNIRILIHNGVKTCNPYNIVDYIQITGYTGLQATPIYTTFGELDVTTYPSCTHFDDVNNPSFDLNFGVCDYYFYSDLTLTNNNLYNLYWRRTVNQINKGKILSALFELNENDIHNLRLNDKIRIDNSWWNINKVIDYNPTKNFLTKVELISIDDELALPRFRIPFILNQGKAIQGVTAIVNDFYKNNNINLSEGSVLIKGLGNVVQEGLKGFVEGDYKVITTSGFYGDLRMGGLSDGTLVFVSSKEDFPAPVGGRINLLDNVTYFVTTTVDLEGDRLIGGINTTIIGGSSENCRLKSTGLAAALITSAYSLPMRNITIEAALAVSLLGDGVTTALDWDGVNFTDCAVIGIVEDYANFIMVNCAFLNSQGLGVRDNIGTVGFLNCFFDCRAGGTLITLPAALTISRRFRVAYSSFVVGVGETGINVSTSATIPAESYILDTVNFSGRGTYITGVDEDDNKSLFINCVGIPNTAVNGQLYMQGNATATTVAATNTFYKVAGTTTASADNSKISHSNNRLTFDAIISRRYLIQCNLSFTSGNNNVCEFGFYDSQIAGIRTPSRTKSTANSGGRAENVSFFCVITATSGDFIEVHTANTSAVTDITVTDMNFIITEIK